LKTFSKLHGAAEEKGVGDAAYHLQQKDKDGSKLEWIIARSGKWVLGIGDEEFVVQPGMSAPDHDKICLSREDKSARLKALLK
jgi:hypothetical protein